MYNPEVKRLGLLLKRNNIDYITCSLRKNRPRVSIAVCGKCRRRMSCPSYGNYLQPSLFPNIVEEKAKRSIRRVVFRSERIKSEVSDLFGKPEQLALSL